jgi:hypothetical protein
MTTVISSTVTAPQSTNDYSTLGWEQKLAVISTHKVTIATAAVRFNCSQNDIREAKKNFKPDMAFDASVYASDFAKRPSHDEHGNIITKTRGRKSSKIATAYAAITTTPVNLEEFCTAHGVSKHCMIQRKRFGASHTDVVVRKINGVQQIYRQVATAETEQSAATPASASTETI